MMLELKQIIDAAHIVAKEYPIRRIELFGSYAEGRNNPESDVDLLVEFKSEAVSLLTLVAVKNRVEELLQVEVDVIHAPLPDDAMITPGKLVEIYAA